ncbi:MAG: phage tail tape measure protein [Acinetobacter johnsonii]
MTQESRLVITVDSRKTKTELDSVDKSLKSVENQGDKTAKKSKDLSAAFKQAGDSAKSAKDGVSSFDGSLGGLSKSIGSTSSLLSGAAVGLAAVGGAAAGAVGALVGMAVAYSKNAQEIQNLANVADAGVVEFQRMALAAQQVGVTQEQLSDQIKDFNEKLGEFVLTGKGEATDAFELLQKHTKMSGDEIKKFALEMQAASGPQAMQMYVNKLEEAGVSQEQMSFLTENMANDFTKLLPILANNGAEIKKWGDAGEEAGAVMQETAIKQALLFGGQVKELELKLKGMQNTVMAAVVPALVDIADAFFNSADNGNTMKSIAETLGNTLRVLGGIAIVVGRSFNALGMAIGAAAAAQVAFVSGDFKGALNIAGQGIKDQIDNIEAGYKQIKAIASTDASSKVKPLERPKSGGGAAGGRGAGVTTGLDTFAKGEESKTKKAASEARKRGDNSAREAERAAREIAKIEYDYSTADQQRKMKLNEEIQNLQKHGQTQYIQQAQDYYKAEEELIKRKYNYDLVEYTATEEEKLRFSMGIRQQEIVTDRDLTQAQKKEKLASLDYEYKHELGNIKLLQQQRIFEATEYQYTEMERIRKRYEFERQEIQRNQSLSDQEKQAKLQGSYVGQSEEEAGVRDQAISDYQNTMGYEDNPLIQQFEVLQKMRELDLLNEEAYQNAKLELQAKSTAGYMEGMLGGFASLVDENSKTYAVLFAAQKAFAVAQAMLNIPAAYSKAYDAVVGTPYIGPYIAPAVGAAAAALQVAQAANIKSTTMSGFKSGGYTGNYGVNQEAGVVHGQEYVLNAEATKRVGINTLNAINNGGTIQAEKQAQANAKVQAANPQPIESNVRVGIFDDRDDMMNQMYGREGEKIVMYHLKRNGMLKP